MNVSDTKVGRGIIFSRRLRNWRVESLISRQADGLCSPLPRFSLLFLVVRDPPPFTRVGNKDLM